VLRRYEPQRERTDDRTLQAGELVLDLEGHRVSRGDLQISLTGTEFRLLYYLALHAGQTISYTRLLEHAWGYETDTAATAPRSHVAHLRRKLSLPRHGPGSITARPGLGYCLVKS